MAREAWNKKNVGKLVALYHPTVGPVVRDVFELTSEGDRQFHV